METKFKGFAFSHRASLKRAGECNVYTIPEMYLFYRYQEVIRWYLRSACTCLQEILPNDDMINSVST